MKFCLHTSLILVKNAVFEQSFASFVKSVVYSSLTVQSYFYILIMIFKKITKGNEQRMRLPPVELWSGDSIHFVLRHVSSNSALAVPSTMSTITKSPNSNSKPITIIFASFLTDKFIEPAQSTIPKP